MTQQQNWTTGKNYILDTAKKKKRKIRDRIGREKFMKEALKKKNELECRWQVRNVHYKILKTFPYA